MAPLIRICLRYLAGYLIARGWLAQDDAGLFDDPDLVTAISFGGAAVCAFASEAWYAFAKRHGWVK
jgi:hypothetical protein